MEIPEVVNKYLSKHHQSLWSIEGIGEHRFDNIVVIPTLAELQNVKTLLRSLAENDSKYFDRTLILFVVNNLDEVEEKIFDENQSTIMYIRSIIRGEKVDETSKIIIDSGLKISLADVSSKGKGMPLKEGGVGFARKIGMDLALAKFDYSAPNKKILVCLDSDCMVSNNYITSIVDSFRASNMNAGYVEYEHRQPESKDEKYAIVCYEIFLRYYHVGLKFARSHFAFPTIGSTMVCGADSYCRIGGMNKRKAAEDFYFMEKLAKITSVQKINGAKVFPASRGSWRVPFGTGQRVNRFLAGTHDEYSLYNPDVFVILKKWIELFNRSIESGAEIIKKAEKIDNNLARFLELNLFEQNWDKIISNTKSESQLAKQKINWFDAFKTLKLIHFLRDNGYPSLNMFETLIQFFHLSANEFKIDLGMLPKSNTDSSKIPPLEIQIEYLNILKNLENHSL